MNTEFTINMNMARRVICVMLAALLVVVGLPAIFAGRAHADQLTSRSMQMSDSAPSGGSIVSGPGSGANVTYRVEITTKQVASSIEIDFCAGTSDPIIGDTCAAPSGMSVAGVGLATAGTETDIVPTGWSATGSDTNNPHIALKLGSGTPAAIGTHYFDLTGITNPNSTGTFYARMYTYNATDPATDGYTGPAGTGVGTYLDYGGFALSTVAVINITARVEEQLTFCVTKLSPASWSSGNDCKDSSSDITSNPPNLTLGKVASGSTAVLDPSRVDDEGDMYSQLSTNATHGATINLRNSNTSCGGLSADNGATCAIPAVNGGANTGMSIKAGTAAFGMCAIADTSYNSVSDPSIVSHLQEKAPYYDSLHPCPTGAGTGSYTTSGTDTTAAYYGMDTTTANVSFDAVNTQDLSHGSVNAANFFGSTVADTTQPVHHDDIHYQFAATPSLTTPAGIYTANLVLIASGTF